MLESVAVAVAGQTSVESVEVSVARSAGAELTTDREQTRHIRLGASQAGF